MRTWRASVGKGDWVRALAAKLSPAIERANRPHLGAKNRRLNGDKDSAPEADTDAFDCPLSQHSPTISCRSERSAVPAIAGIETLKDRVEFGYRVVRHPAGDAAEVQVAFRDG